MALRLLLACLLLSSFSTGCWVIEEIDAGQELLEKHSAKVEEVEEEDPDKEWAFMEKLDPEYWAKARTITKGEGNSDIVNCKVGGSTQFMKKSECAGRNGIAVR